eukprot:923872-Amphidinium_carterae.1
MLGRGRSVRANRNRKFTRNPFLYRSLLCWAQPRSDSVTANMEPSASNAPEKSPCMSVCLGWSRTP